MSTAVFGDFLDQAEWHIQAAARSLDETVDPTATPQLLRLVTSMSRHLDDRIPLYADGVIATADLRPWDRAIADSGAALHRAADSLTQGMAAARITGQQPAGDLGRFLDLAATSLTAGRDLLHTRPPLGAICRKAGRNGHRW